MKKLISLLLSLCLMAGLSTIALAADKTTSPATLESLDDKAVIGIYGIYHYIGEGTPPIEIPVGPDGGGSTELPDGTEVKVDGDEAYAGWRVVIIPVTAAEHQEAYAWASGKVSSMDSAPLVYYVMFYYGDEQREPTDSFRITIRFPSSNDKTAMFFMTGAGVPLRDSAARFSGSSVTFNTGATGIGHTGYYLFLKYSGGNGGGGGHGDGGYKDDVILRTDRPTLRPTGTGTGTDTTTTSPKTGDAGIAVYAALSLLSLTGGAWISKKHRH